MSESVESCGSCRFFLLSDATSKQPEGACRRFPPQIQVMNWVGEAVPPGVQVGQPKPPQIAYGVVGVGAAFPTLSAETGWCGCWEMPGRLMN